MINHQKNIYIYILKVKPIHKKKCSKTCKIGEKICDSKIQIRNKDIVFENQFCQKFKSLKNWMPRLIKQVQ